LVFALDVLEGHNSGCLLMDHSTKTSLALDNDIRNTHLAAKGRQENNKLDGINIMSNDNERSLLGLNQGNNMVQAIFDKERFLGFLLIKLGHPLSKCRVKPYNGLALSSDSCSCSKTLLLLLLTLRTVLVKELEELSGSVLVQSMRELCNGRGNLQTLIKDNLLALKTDIFRPLDEPSQVSPRTDILTYSMFNKCR